MKVFNYNRSAYTTSTGAVVDPIHQLKLYDMNIPAVRIKCPPGLRLNFSDDYQSMSFSATLKHNSSKINAGKEIKDMLQQFITKYDGKIVDNLEMIDAGSCGQEAVVIQLDPNEPVDQNDIFLIPMIMNDVPSIGMDADIPMNRKRTNMFFIAYISLNNFKNSVTKFVITANCCHNQDSPLFLITPIW